MRGHVRSTAAWQRLDDDGPERQGADDAVTARKRSARARQAGFWDEGGSATAAYGEDDQIPIGSTLIDVADRTDSCRMVWSWQE